MVRLLASTAILFASILSLIEILQVFPVYDYINDYWSTNDWRYGIQRKKRIASGNNSKHIAQHCYAGAAKYCYRYKVLVV